MNTIIIYFFFAEREKFQKMPSLFPFSYEPKENEGREKIGVQEQRKKKEGRRKKNPKNI